MNRNAMKKKLLVTCMALGGGLLPGLASAATFYLCAGTTTVSMPDGTPPITMWGYALDDDADLTNGCGGAVQSPGPLLTVPYDDPDPSVTIYLRNDLPIDTSVMVPGQGGALTPVFSAPDAQGRVRATSLTQVTAPGAIGTYSWSNFKPGSFTYHSGTHMAVQVQMGMYGAMKKDAALNTAYAGVPYDQEAILFYSEIDPALHAAVADGSYGTAPGPTSTINYQPKYFLINGAPYGAGNTPLPAASVGQRTLLRLYNMGLRTVAPTLLGEYVKVVAEDGRPYPYAREQYSLMMTAGKTQDAIMTAAHNGTYAVYDRMLNLSSGAMAPGGLYAFLNVGDVAAGTPIALPDSYTVAEDTPLTVDAVLGVLSNDSDPNGLTLTAALAGAVSQGSVTLNPTGDFGYTPPANFNGTASFTYTASNGTLSSTPATVTITVTPVNDPPVAADDAYSLVSGTALTVAAAGVLANDSDVDGDPLSATQVTAPVNGTLSLAADGSFNYTPNAGYSGSDSFTYVANDGVVDSNVATVTLNVTAAVNQPPIAVDDSATITMNTSQVIAVLANDSDPDGTLDPATVTLTSLPGKKGNTATVNTDGTITFTPRTSFRGSDTFTYTVQDNQGAVSNRATVRVNVVR
ncbi:MAG TPA: Ig-like domain-containing protein [Gammaproteobacteria bacterium]